MSHLPSRIGSAERLPELASLSPGPWSAPWKTWGLTLAVVAFAVIGNTALGHGMRQVGIAITINPLPYVYAFANPWVVAGFLVLVLWMIAELALLSRADLSFVLPVTSSAYVLIAVAGHFVLQEHISATRWAGIAVITLGVIMVAETPARTTPEPPPEGHHR